MREKKPPHIFIIKFTPLRLETLKSILAKKKKNKKIHTSLYLMIPSLYINYRNWLIVVYKTTLGKDHQTKSDDFTQLTTARIFFSF